MALIEYACYNGNQKLANINIGGNEIRKVYAGSELVWEKIYYTEGQIISEIKDAGTFTIPIENTGLYEVILIGAGGGSVAAGSGGGSSNNNSGYAYAISGS